MINLLDYLIIVIISTTLTGLFKYYSLRNNLIDTPNDRSSHIKPTPRGGGISIVIIFFLALIYFWGDLNATSNNLIASILIGGFVVSVIGYWDDHCSISAKWRFLTHIIATFISLLIITNLPDITYFTVSFNYPFILYFLLSIALVWLINLYNFMDGIDGIASIEAIIILLCASVIFYVQGDSNTPKLLLILAASIVGFLFWNWPPAKIFMGDACSGFLGFTIGLIAISTSINDEINLWSWLILMAVFVVDATYTLIRRIFDKEKWYEAHRSHGYQILARKYKSHKKVTLAVLVINVLWLFPLAYLAALYEYSAPILTLIAISPLIFIDYKVGAGIRNN